MWQIWWVETRSHLWKCISSCKGGRKPSVWPLFWEGGGFPKCWKDVQKVNVDPLHKICPLCLLAFTLKFYTTLIIRTKVFYNYKNIMQLHIPCTTEECTCLPPPQKGGKVKSRQFPCSAPSSDVHLLQLSRNPILIFCAPDTKLQS